MAPSGGGGSGQPGASFVEDPRTRGYDARQDPYGEYYAEQDQFYEQRAGNEGQWYGQPGHRAEFDEYGGITSFSDEEVDELDSRMGRAMIRTQGGEPRSKSMMRYNELERERTRRRQTVVNEQHKRIRCFPGTLKLSMLNTGIIPLKKGKF